MDVGFVFVLALLCLYNFIILSLFDHLDHCASARYVFMLKERAGGGGTLNKQKKKKEWFGGQQTRRRYCREKHPRL